jgi:glycosyltransferase involved in cell wall biosynthesis
MYGQYKRIASISVAATDSLTAWLPEVRSKVVLNPNGVSIDVFASSSTSGKQALFSIPEEVPVILCVGRFELVKDHRTLLHAVSLVPNVVLVLAGDGSLWGQLHELADALGIASRIRFVGRRTDIPDLLNAADLYVQPSRAEGFGIATLEAMAAGKPVVVSDVPGLAEVVGDAGLLFPVGDVSKLAERISTLLGDDAQRKCLAHSARRQARMFSLEKTMDSYEELYRDVTRTLT